MTGAGSPGTLVPGTPKPASATRCLQWRCNQLVRICAFFRPEFLNAATERLRDVEISIRVDGELMRPPHSTGECAKRSPGIKQLSVQIVLQELLRHSIGNPQKVVA